MESIGLENKEGSLEAAKHVLIKTLNSTIIHNVKIYLNGYVKSLSSVRSKAIASTSALLFDVRVASNA